MSSQLNQTQQAERWSVQPYQVLMILVYDLTRTKGTSPTVPGQVDKVVVVCFTDNPQT